MPVADCVFRTLTELQIIQPKISGIAKPKPTRAQNKMPAMEKSSRLLAVSAKAGCDEAASPATVAITKTARKAARPMKTHVAICSGRIVNLRFTKYQCPVIIVPRTEPSRSAALMKLPAAIQLGTPAAVEKAEGNFAIAVKPVRMANAAKILPPRFSKKIVKARKKTLAANKVTT